MYKYEKKKKMKKGLQRIISFFANVKRFGF